MQEATFLMVYDAFPDCGDGFDVGVRLYQQYGTSVLAEQAHEPLALTQNAAWKPQRFRIQKPLTLLPGDQIDITVDPRDNSDCDGVFVINLQIWEAGNDVQ